MKTTEKIQALNAFVAALDINKEELTAWFGKTEETTDLLPFVYEVSKNKLEVSTIFNPKRKLWGIELLPGFAVALKCGSGNNVTDTTWQSVKNFATNTIVNGKQGDLPSESFRSDRSKMLKKKMNATAEFLKGKGIDADGYFGLVWCCARYNRGDAYCIDLRFGDDLYLDLYQEGTSPDDRVGVAF